MTVTYLKRSTRSAETDQTDVRAAVQAMLADLSKGGEAAATRMARLRAARLGGLQCSNRRHMYNVVR